MSILIVCDGCQRKLRLSDSLAGKTVKCPHCDHKSRLTLQEPKTEPPKNPAEKKKPQLPRKAVPPETEASDGSTEETVDDLAEAPTKPNVVPVVPPAPARSGRSIALTILILGGALIVVLLVGGAVVYLFSGTQTSGVVAGKVTLNGQPLDMAHIEFVDAGGKPGKHEAISDANGGFKVPGKVPPGAYKICVTKFALADGKQPVNVDIEELKAQGDLRNVLPAHYATPEETTLRCEVKAGDNTIPIALDR